ncbi:MAG: hypothetical protein GTO02_01205 [Candidatus Dadabacteria bacterium]|nr:hypothetical protein [Candidatus Dadabacteria bacterium]NIQ13058.1 hypothetical protein [Candidatus Dadabacteria bacterium]
MKLKFLIFSVILIPLISSCANTRRITEVINPKDIDKGKLEDTPYTYTPIYKLKVGSIKKLRSKMGDIVEIVDKKFGDYSKCADIKDKGFVARKYKIVVVDGTFECEFHDGRCNGEIDSDSKLIIVSYKAFNREGKLPLLKHEWAHAYNILRSNHSNLKKVKKCTKY